MSYRIKLGDCLEVLRSMRPDSVDAIVTDPPYGLEFMGKEWDGADGFRRSLNAADVGRDDVFGRTSARGPEYHAGSAFQAFSEAWAREALRVLKPGGHLLAFGGTRTYHRIACAIEDAGFEIRDSIDWIYGQGFPKSLDVSKAIDKMMGATREQTGRMKTRHGGGSSERSDHIHQLDPAISEWPETAPATDAAKRFDGWGTALKPAHEPIVVARKPLAGTVAENVLAHGTGGINVEACRVRGNTSEMEGRSGQSSPNQVWGAGIGHDGMWSPSASGRWPPNVLLTHAPECDGSCVEGCPIAMMDRQSGVLTSGVLGPENYRGQPRFQNVYRVLDDNVGKRLTSSTFGGDSGGASRFFPIFEWSEFDFLYCGKASTKDRGGKMNKHPTVKPVALMRWLCRLVTPSGGIIVDPFLGSGTTAVAALQEGFHVVGVEREPAYVAIAEARIAAIGT